MDVPLENLFSQDNGQAFALGVLTLGDYQTTQALCGRMHAESQMQILGTRLKLPVSRITDDSLAFVIPRETGAELQALGESLQSQFAGLKQLRSGETLPVPVRLCLFPADASASLPAPDRLLDGMQAINKQAGYPGSPRLTLVRDREQLDAMLEPLRTQDRLSGALLMDRLVLYSQRILSLDSIGSDCFHHEILVRLVDRDGQLWMPSHFLPEAERLGLMPEIDRFVIRHTYAWLAAHRPGRETAYQWTAINLSAQSLMTPDLVAFIDARQQAAGIRPTNICFELTESSRIDDLPQAVATMTALRERGYRFALDDYGRGYASLSHLRDLPVDLVKIDGSFITGIDRHPSNRELVRELCLACRRMGKQTVAEYVENMQELDCITGLGIDFAQGHAIEKPIPLDLVEHHEAQLP